MSAPVTDDGSVFRRNMAALRRGHAGLAGQVESATPCELTWAEAKSGVAVASVEGPGGRASWLASKYDPEKEAAKLLGEIDRSKVACVTLIGMGLGYHVAQAVREAGPKDMVVVYEPDLGLMHAVLQKMDHTAWLSDRRVMIFAGEVDRAKVVQAIEPVQATVIQGAKVVVHPPSRQREAEAVGQFGEAFKEALSYCRTTLATSLVNAARTCENLMMNMPWYMAGSTVNELVDAAKGYPAVCVAAGPSLVKNVELLSDPEVRRKVVVISTQTTLRPLLDRGIRPDYVTALDYSPISSRFYEGLPDLDDITLVAEPKAHTAILRSFPGPIRVCHSEFNDQLLGKMARPIQPIKAGATVAHLSFYLAQMLGCDPIMMIGQDLGFSDGLYYAPGTAVHRVWSSELGAFNTLEMMEWQRIVRMRAHLRRAEDQNGKPIFTDEQMATYLKQFERDFESAPQTVIDATEGGMAKAHTVAMPLVDALEKHATRDVPTLPLAQRMLDRDRLSRLDEMLNQRQGEMRELKRTSHQAAGLISDMIRHQRDQAKMHRLFEKLQKVKRKTERELAEAFTAVNHLNMIGAYRRTRADRELTHLTSDALGKQTQQLERDRDNLVWLEQACDEALSIFGRTISSLPEVMAMNDRQQTSPSLDATKSIKAAA